ncbi:lamin tail domain-containing protein [Dokdonella koreensis]|uniref:Endonuclease/exonuclease/phosphatase n=1 Tax=Dokdonella koreensis DS-123 TaxID=1300342 RepID=A0A160DX50_9GAMM|nr:lamin tail domain-containing protein [Dokdonella koreensis]ANB19259.1 Endonuclease/exonuclease/phosphatase [Dokdonella koreensis DS-123]
MAFVRTYRLAAGLLLVLSASAAQAQMRITEWMYDGAGGEFIELTNVGTTAVDMTGWRYDDDSANPAIGFDLSGFGSVQPGESVVLAESETEAFRSDWRLCAGAKILGGYTNNLGRADQINLFDGSGTLVDRLTYGDQAFPGSIRTTGASGWVSAAGLGANNVFAWTLSAVADGEGSVTSNNGAIGSPGRSTRAGTAYDPCGGGAQAQMRITEWMYDGAGGEYIELTNVGTAPADMTGWRYDDDSANPAIGFDLSGFGSVQPGESVVLAESETEAFRSDWRLCAGAKILGGYTNNLGRADQINLFDASGTLVDRLTYGDQAFPGSIRTTGASGWVSAAGLGADDVFAWTLSAVADGEGSVTSNNGAIGNPGRSTRAGTAYDPCDGGGPAPVLATIAAGSQFACGLDAGGLPYCWGSDAGGRLGNGAAVTSNMVSPYPVDLTGLPAGTRFASIVAGMSFACGLTSDGLAYCWGQDEYGQLGNGAAVTANQPAPVAVDMTPLAGKGFVSLAAGSTHACGIAETGTAYCWGRSGPLGLPAGVTGNQASPSPVDMARLPADTSFVSLSAASGHTCGLASDGNLYCWGRNGNGQLGIGTSGQTDLPISAVVTSGLPAGTHFAAVTAGDSHSCALTTGDVAYCWGAGINGAVGNGAQSLDILLPNPVVTTTIPAGTHFIALEGGSTNTCGILDTGAAYCWGFANWGALGTGDGTSRYSPHPVATATLPPGTVFTELSAENNLTCGATAAGRFYCWGRDDQGQQGNGPSLTADPSLVPTLVEPFAPVTGLPPTITAADSIVVGSVGDPTNLGTTLTIADPDSPLAGLTIQVTTANASVITPAGVTLSGEGAERTVTFAPVGRGLSNVTFIVTDPDGNGQSATLQYASSTQAPDPSGRYHHHISDASAALDVGDGYVILLNDETNTIFLHRAGETGRPVKTWAFNASQLGTSSEIDFEGITRSGDLLLLTGSHGNNRSGSARPERRTFVAATITGSGAGTELVFRGRYNNLWAELRAWDQTNGHGLGANALGFIAATAGGVLPNAPGGFNIEGLEFNPDGSAVYLGFRAPTIQREGRYDALIVPLLNAAALTNGTPGSGPAVFGAPIFLDLGGRSIRALASNAQGDYLISAGPSPQNESWALYTWDGRPDHAPQFNQTLPSDDGLTGGAWEAIGAVPHPLVEGATVRVITDSGDTNFYGTGATKDLQQVYQKSYSQAFTLAAVPTDRPAMRITEWMYDGAGGEFIELTNVGTTAVDMTGWRYDDDSADPAIGFDLSGFGSVQPGESVVLAESETEAFRSDWRLCAGAKILGGYTNNLGRADQINLFDASGTLVDRLTYGDQAFPGSIRTTGASGWVSAAGLGADDVFAWTLSAVADGEGSVTSNNGAIGSPGRSTRAGVAYDPCGSVTEYLLTVAIEGAGQGLVSGDGIACPGDCEQRYAAGTAVQLTATPASGFVFGGWSGACSGSAACTVAMSADQNVIATFVAAPLPVLAFDPASLDFGEVQTGTTATPLTATLRNTGAADASELNFTAPGGAFTADTSACGTVLPAQASCAVVVSFAPTAAGPATAVLGVGSAGGVTATLGLQGVGRVPVPQTDLAVGLVAHLDYAQRGQLLDYVVTVSNLGPDPTTAASVASSLSPALDLDFATWLCIDAAGSGCTASGTGNLGDAGLTIPVGGSVSYLVSAPVRWEADGAVTTQAQAMDDRDPNLGNNTAEVSGQVVIHRDGFEPENPGALPLDAVSASLATGDTLGLTWPAPGQPLIETVLAAVPDGLQPASGAFRLERLNHGVRTWLRLVAQDEGGNAYATGWLAVVAGAELRLALVPAPRPEDASGGTGAPTARLRVAGAELQLPLAGQPVAYRLRSALPLVVAPEGDAD